MLEQSVWAQYHPEKSIREVLAALYGCELSQLIADEGVLYAEIKRTLTKKELRLFAMAEAGNSEEAMMETLGYDSAALNDARKKSYHKLRNKVRSRIKAVQETKE